MEQTQTNEILKKEETIAENKPMTVLDYILLSRYFLPILTTVGWVIGFTISQIKFFEILAYFSISILPRNPCSRRRLLSPVIMLTLYPKEDSTALLNLS